jgi:four helix bundle protein
MPGTSHRDLRVWQVAMEIATSCYSLTKQLPKEELFGLTGQIRRAAASVPANIAEGYGRFSKRDTARFLNIANGSLVELDTHLELALRAGFLDRAGVDAVTNDCRALSAMLSAFKAALRGAGRRPPQSPVPSPVSTSAVSAP